MARARFPTAETETMTMRDFIALFGLAIIAWITFAALTQRRPTADELFGCTAAQADPMSGECR